MFDEFLEEYKYNWKMADNQYTEERYRNSLSPKQVEKAQSSPTTSILLRIKWALKNLKMRIEAARFPEILAIAMIVFSISLILLIVSLGWNILTSETTLYRWSMTLYLVSGLLVLNLMPSTVAYNRKKYEKRSINDKHSTIIIYALFGYVLLLFLNRVRTKIDQLAKWNRLSSYFEKREELKWKWPIYREQLERISLRLKRDEKSQIISAKSCLFGYPTGKNVRFKLMQSYSVYIKHSAFQSIKSCGRSESQLLRKL